GKIAEDQFGRTFRHDIRGMGVTFTTPATVLDGKETSHALILITPDGQRTMHAFVGCSAEIDAALLDAPTIAAAKILYLEGYLFDSPRAVSAFQLWSAMAKSAGRRVALALSDAGCVARHRAEFRDFIAVGVDILIANEREVMALYDTPTFDEAVLKAKQDVALAVLTRSGSDTVVANKGAVITLPIERVSKVVDATGAGDLYASGLLYGLSHGMSIRDAGRLGAFAASEIIGQVGARPEARLGNLARMRGLFERRSA
ncbi:MAG: adenosine kinase, partial [Hyphomicrobium sp.]